MNKHPGLSVALGRSALAAALLCIAMQPAFPQDPSSALNLASTGADSKGFRQKVAYCPVNVRTTQLVSSLNLHTHVNDDPVLRADPVRPQVTPPETPHQNSGGISAGPLLRSPMPQTLFQGHADYATCIDNATGATAIVFACLGAAIIHAPAGGVAGLFIGDGLGRFFLGPLACVPDPIR